MSAGLGISDCIALAEVIIAAYQCWTRIPDEMRTFLSLVHDLKTQAESLEDNSVFEFQVLLVRERKVLYDWISDTFDILKALQDIEERARNDSQLFQRLRWLFDRKLKPLAKQMSKQTDALKSFKQDLLLRSTTANAFENRTRFIRGENACSVDQLRQLEENNKAQQH